MSTPVLLQVHPVPTIIIIYSSIVQYMLYTTCYIVGQGLVYQKHPILNLGKQKQMLK